MYIYVYAIFVRKIKTEMYMYCTMFGKLSEMFRSHMLYLAYLA